jgi:hypothetical protein
MKIIAFDAGNRPIFSIPLLFEVDGHKLALDTFISSSVTMKSFLMA